MRPRRLRISIFILAILGLQAVPVAREFTGARETLWPFLSWGMFRHASDPPVEATRQRILATTADGTRRVWPEDSGFDPFAFRRYYQIPIAEGDSAAARDLARRLTRRWAAPVREIAVEETVFKLDDDGIRETTSLRWFTTGPR
jgi:hypothetical protein